MSIFPTCTVFADLITAYPSWPALSSFLKSEEGGSLRIDENGTALAPGALALIRYVKGKSDLSKPHVRAFRSVVWDTLLHAPVSVTPFKSADGEGLTPDIAALPVSNFTVEQYPDGVMIGMFWDKSSAQWRIHTRSTLGAQCRYYSQTTTFADMFWNAVSAARLNLDALDKKSTYTFVLQHPENRIVCPVVTPAIWLVERIEIHPDNRVSFHTVSDSPLIPARIYAASWSDIHERIMDWNARFRHNVQGVVIKDATGRRWKIRTPEYNRVRQLRGNSARRDYIWLSAWKADTLRDYLRIYPEEKYLAETVINRWKQATTAVYHIYVDVFKARTLDKTLIPPKYRPLVYGLHGKFLEELKPAGKTVDWKTAMTYMNSRDVAQMLFVINWELRAAARTVDAPPEIPFEPSSSAAAAPEAEAAH